MSGRKRTQLVPDGLGDYTPAAPAVSGVSFEHGMWIATLIVALLGVATVLVGAIIANSNSQIIFAIYLTPEGETGASATGQALFNNAADTITYSISFANISVVESFRINGPIMAGMTTAPISIAFCGTPNLDLVCDVFTIPNYLSGVLRIVEPGGYDPNPYLLDIRANPELYYWEVTTSLHPEGALRGQLYAIGE